VRACSPTDFIKELAQIFMGVTCDHSLGGHKSLQCFTNVYCRKRVPLGVPDAPNPLKTDITSSYLFVNLHKTTSKQRQKMPKNTLEVSLVISRKAPNLTK
jgi:hypothetical protein